MLSAPAFREHTSSLSFRDGLGERFVAADADSGELVQILRLPQALVDVPAFEFALRERISRLATFRHAGYVRAYRLDRAQPPAPGLSMVSEHVEGIRLSDLLRVAHERHVDLDVSTGLFVTRQLLQATAALHEHAPDVANGLISPERLIVTAKARIAIAEQAACVAIEQLRYSPERLWRELRIAVGPGTSPMRFSRRTDVLSIGLVALALVLGRPLREDEFPDRISMLLDQARERSALGYERRLSQPLREWLGRTLQLDPATSFTSTSEAWLHFENIVAADPLYMSAPIALEVFLFRCTAALIQAPVTESPAGANPAFRPADVHAEQGISAKDFSNGLHSAASVPVVDPERRMPDTGSWCVPTSRARSTLHADAIDWTAIADQATAVATAGDITQLFSDADLPAPDLTGRELPASPERPVDPGSAFSSAGTLDFTGVVTDILPEPMADAVPQVMDDAAAEAQWVDQTRRVNRWSKLRTTAVAAALVGVLPGGFMLTRFVRPAVVAASDTGTLRVETSPHGLQVFVDGVEHGRTPARISVSAGEHMLEVRGRGTPRVLPVKVAAGAETVQVLEFAARPHNAPPPASEPAAATVVPTVAATQTWGWIAVKAEGPIEIHVGDRVVRTTGGERIRMGAGRHELELVNVAEGYRAVRVAHVVPGKVTQLVMDPPATGMVNLNASPWAEVWIGGRRVGETPLANVSVPVGRHEVVFRHPNLGEKREAISVTSGAPVRLSMNMQ